MKQAFFNSESFEQTKYGMDLIVMLYQKERAFDPILKHCRCIPRMGICYSNKSPINFRMDGLFYKTLWAVLIA